MADLAVEWHLIGASNIVDIAALLVVIDDQTCCQLALDQRDVDEGVARSARRAALGHRIATIKAGLILGQVWLVGDVTHSAAHGARAKQGALRTGQHFDALKVNRIDIQVAARHRAWCVVQIERDVGLSAGGAGDLQAGGVGGQAANIHGRGAGTLRSRADVRQIFNQLFEVGDVQLLERLAAERLNGHGDLVDRLFTAGRRNDDILDGAIAFGRRCIGCKGGSRSHRDQHRRSGGDH